MSCLDDQPTTQLKPQCKVSVLWLIPVCWWRWHGNSSCHCLNIIFQESKSLMCCYPLQTRAREPHWRNLQQCRKQPRKWFSHRDPIGWTCQWCCRNGQTSSTWTLASQHYKQRPKDSRATATSSQQTQGNKCKRNLLCCVFLIVKAILFIISCFPLTGVFIMYKSWSFKHRVWLQKGKHTWSSQLLADWFILSLDAMALMACETHHAVSLRILYSQTIGGGWGMDSRVSLWCGSLLRGKLDLFTFQNIFCFLYLFFTWSFCLLY